MKWAMLEHVCTWAPAAHANVKLRQKFPEQFVHISDELHAQLVSAHSNLDKVVRQVNSIKERQVRK